MYTFGEHTVRPRVQPDTYFQEKYCTITAIIKRTYVQNELVKIEFWISFCWILWIYSNAWTYVLYRYVYVLSIIQNQIWRRFMIDWWPFTEVRQIQINLCVCVCASVYGTFVSVRILIRHSRNFFFVINFSFTHIFASLRIQARANHQSKFVYHGNSTVIHVSE